MRMNAGIILAGKEPDFVNVLRQSNAAAGEANQVRQQNALRQLYDSQGEGIASGDQNALNALARLDPSASLGIQGARQGLEAGALNMDATRQRMDILSSQEKRAIEAHAAKLSAADRAAQAQKIQQGLMGGIALYQNGDLEGLNRMLQGVGEQPLQSIDQFPSVAVKYKGVLDALESVKDFGAPDKPADEYGRYVQEETASGRQPLSRIDFHKAKQKSSSIEVGADGSVRIVEGGGRKDPNDASDPTSPAAMIATIDGILNDPALDRATGVFSPLQNIPGTPQKRFGTRAEQLQGQAFLQAFESLKGAGQITEIEGQKATQAIGRLDTAQSAADYRQALGELREVLSAARDRGSRTEEPASAEVPAISDDAGYDALPSGTEFIDPDGVRRRKP